MTKISGAEMQNDHKHWLREIERWEQWLSVWQRQQDSLQDGIERFRKSIQQHAFRVNTHGKQLEAHKKAILNCEREMAAQPKGADVSPEIRKEYADSDVCHKAQSAEHELLKKEHHTYQAVLSLLRGEPLRED